MTSSEERAWEKVSDLEDQIADTKANCDLAIEGRDIKIKELEKENAELKDDNKVMADNYSKMEQKFYNNLTKAKDHIKTLLDCLKQDRNDPQTNYYVCQYMDKAEQFLKGENIILEDVQAGNSPFDADEVFHKEMKAYPKEKVK